MSIPINPLNSAELVRYERDPNALTDESTPSVMISTVDRSSVDTVLHYEKSPFLMRKMHAQGAIILAIANAGDSPLAALAGCAIPMPARHDAILPFAKVVPMRLLSHIVAVQAAIDVDRPRNLVYNRLTLYHPGNHKRHGSRSRCHGHSGYCRVIREGAAISRIKRMRMTNRSQNKANEIIGITTPI
ncbi:MAG: hypothetical protein ACRD19_17350 [Terriglobia bacterium]